MKAKRRHSRYDGDEVRYITEGGKQVKADDEWFEQEAREWEHHGLDIDLVYMARPLLEGTAEQQALAHKFLAKVRDNYLEAPEAQTRLVALLGREGVGVGAVPHQTEAQFNEAWDDFSGSAKGKSLGDVSFGHSDASRRQALSEGVNPEAGRSS